MTAVRQVVCAVALLGVSGTLSSAYGESMESPRIRIAEVLEDRFGYAVTGFREAVSAVGEDVAVHVEVHDRDAGDLPGVLQRFLELPQAYWIRTSEEEIRILGAGPLGALYGMTELERLIRLRGGALLPGSILDAPDLETRAVHIVLRGLSPERLRQLITRARQAGMNLLVLQLADGVRLDSAPAVARPDALSKEELAAVAEFAIQNGLEVVPEIKLLTHQEKLLKNTRPDLMFDSRTYDPSKEETYVVVFSLLDEVIELLRPRAVHIGHDELFGWQRLRRGRRTTTERTLPPELYLESVLRLHSFLLERDVETWMWGDMLLSPEEFPGMFESHLHGNREYALLRDRIPPDVVICDWHYFGSEKTFPSAKAFADLGHRVLGATWWNRQTMRNFSRYVAAMDGEGMIAGTWVREGRSKRMDAMIEASGEAFWHAGH